MIPGPLPYIGLAPTDGSASDTEFLSPDRVVAYLRTLAPPGVWEVIGDVYPCHLRDIAFTTPAADAAPWTVINGRSVLDYAPAAGDFLGVAITDLEGLNSTLTRGVTKKTIELGGGTLEREHAGPRQITVKGVMIATSSCGLEWAERWLHHILGTPFCDPCDVAAYSFRQCCPPDVDESFYGYTGYWNVFGAGTLSGPIIRPLSTVDANPGDLTRQSCYLAEVEFTLGVEDPYLYKPWKLVATGWDCIAFPGTQRLGIDGIVVDFNDSTTGALAIVRGSDCGADPETLFTFGTLDVGAHLIYDAARKTVTVIEADGTIVDALAAGFVDTGGLPLEWLQQQSGCADPFCVCPSGDGAGTTIYRQHKEFG